MKVISMMGFWQNKKGLSVCRVLMPKTQTWKILWHCIFKSIFKRGVPPTITQSLAFNAVIFAQYKYNLFENKSVLDVNLYFFFCTVQFNIDSYTCSAICVHFVYIYTVLQIRGVNKCLGLLREKTFSALYPTTP